MSDDYKYQYFTKEEVERGVRQLLLHQRFCRELRGKATPLTAAEQVEFERLTSSGLSGFFDILWRPEITTALDAIVRKAGADVRAKS